MIRYFTEHYSLNWVYLSASFMSHHFGKAKRADLYDNLYAMSILFKRNLEISVIFVAPVDSEGLCD